MYGQIHLEKSIRCISLYREQRHKKAEEVLHSHSGKASSKKLVWTSIFPLATLACLIQMAFLLTQKS